MPKPEIHTKNKDKVPRNFSIIFIALTFGIILLGIYFYNSQRENILTQQKNELSAISYYKSKQIELWIDERIKHANSVLQNKHRVEQIKSYIINPEPSGQNDNITEWFKYLSELYDYENITLYDNDYKPLISIQSNKEFDNNEIEIIRKNEPVNEIIISDLHQHDSASPIHLNIFIPIKYSVNGNAEHTAVLAFLIDLQTFIFPILLDIPTSYSTMESIIAEKKENSVLFLSELKFKQHTAMKFMIPLTESDVIVVQASGGKTGITQGKDYRGKEVLAHINVVRDTKWFLITKIDMDEINSPILKQTSLIFLIALACIIAAGIIIALVWRNQKAIHYRSLYQKEAESRAIAEHYVYLSKYANDIILLADENFKIVLANDKAFECYGYTKEEFLELNVQNIRVPELADGIKKDVEHIKKKDSILFKTEHKRKDGSRFPVEVSSRLIEAGGKIYYQNIIRDITEREIAEEKFKESEEKFRSIIEHSTVLFYSHTPDHVIKYMSPQSQEFFDCEPEEAMVNWTNFATANPVNELGLYLTKRAIDTGKAQPPYELELKGLKERIIWVEVHESPVVVNGKTAAIVGSLTDITARKKAEERIFKLNRIYRVLSEINQAIVRIKNEKEIFEQVCSILVEIGTFRMVCITEHDFNNARTTMHAFNGYNKGYTDIIISQSKTLLSSDNPFYGEILQKKFLIFNDLEKDLNLPWRKESVKRGYCSLCIVPIAVNNDRNITLNLYSGEPNFFNREEIELLTELSADVSFALNSLELERRRLEAEQNVISTKQMLEKITGTTPAYISVYDIYKQETLYHNNSIIEKLGYSKEQTRKIWEMSSEEAAVLYHPDDLANIYDMDKNILKLKDDEVIKVEYRLKDCKGSWRWFEHSTRVFQRNDDGIPTHSVNIIMDINDRKIGEELVLRANEKLKILYEAGKKLIATLNITELYDRMYEYVSKIADCEELFVADYNPEEEIIKYSYLKAKSLPHGIDTGKIPPIPLAPPGYGILSEVIRSGKSQLFNDYQKSLEKSKVKYTIDQKGDLTKPDMNNPESNYKLRSAILVPIKLGERVFAVVQMYSVRKNAYTNDQLELVESLMHQVALASKNILLYKQAQDEILVRRKTEEELRKSEERFSLAFKLSPIATLLTRLKDGIIIDANEECGNLSGLPIEEIIGKKTSDLKIIYGESGREKMIAELREKGTIVDYEAKVPNVKTGLRDILSTMQVIKVQGEDCILSMIMDVTDKKKSEEQLRKLSRAVNQSPASIIITNTKGAIEYVNSKFTEVTGYNYEEVIGQNPRILKSGETPEEVYKELWETISSGKEWHGELYNKRKNGKLFWEWASVSPIFDSAGNITNYLAVKEDITVQKVIQEQILLQATLLQNIHDAVIYVDINFKIRSWNEGAQSIYGWSVNEAIDKIIHELVKTEFYGTNIDNIAAIIRKTGAWKGEILQITKDNRKINVLSSVSSIKNNIGRVIGVVIVNKDITEIKQHEIKIRNSLKEKELLLKEIHHRVKNNLQVISSLLKMQAVYIKDPTALEYFKISSQRVKSMALIHEQLYRSADLSRIDFHNYVKKLANHLYQTYGININTVKLNINIKNIKLGIDTAIPCGLLVNELISNSLKHAFTGKNEGSIYVEMTDEDNTYVLSVRDSGKCFPAEVDFRNTETMGMQLINTLTEQIDGQIELKRENGTEFIVTFKKAKYKARI